MKKRFRDTDIWQKRWFRELPPTMKCAWDYIVDHCDNVGVWDGDTAAADFYIGQCVDWEVFRERVNGNIEVMESGKWFVVDFCAFQHSDLREDSKSRPILSYIALLEKHGLKERVLKAFAKPMRRVSPKKPKPAATEVPTVPKRIYAESVLLTEAEYRTLVERAGSEKVAKAAIEKLSTYKLSSGKRYKSDYNAILTWALGSVMGQKGGAIPRAPEKPKAVGCDVCGKECVREFGYWVCREHGKREDLE